MSTFICACCVCSVPFLPHIVSLFKLEYYKGTDVKTSLNNDVLFACFIYLRITTLERNKHSVEQRRCMHTLVQMKSEPAVTQ
jgi:hypothetical protein